MNSSLNTRSTPLWIALVALWCTATGNAQVTVPEGLHSRTVLSEPTFGSIRGILEWSVDGSLIVARGGGGGASGQLIKVDLTTGIVTELVSGLPLGTPDRMVWGDGSSLLGDDLILADHNTEETDSCCDGRVFRVDLDTLSFIAIAEGNPEYLTPGDPYGVAVSPGGAFAPGLYVVDFEGASTQLPLIYRINPDGSSETFAVDGSQWPINASPKDLAFDPTGAYGGDLFVSDDGSPDQVWRVSPTGTISPFAGFGRPTALAFGPGGVWGPSLYVLDHAGLESTVYQVDPSGVATPFATGFRSAATSTPDICFSDDGTTLYVAIEDEITAISIDAPFERAECNGDGNVDISDSVFLLGYLFLSAEVPTCRDACDANDDGLLDLADSIFSLNYTFGGGPAPAAPFGVCGSDPTADGLECIESGCP